MDTILITGDEKTFYAVEVDLEKGKGSQVIQALITGNYRRVPAPHANVGGVYVMAGMYRLTNGKATETAEEWLKAHVPEQDSEAGPSAEEDLLLVCRDVAAFDGTGMDSDLFERMLEGFKQRMGIALSRMEGEQNGGYSAETPSTT